MDAMLYLHVLLDDDFCKSHSFLIQEVRYSIRSFRGGNEFIRGRIVLHPDTDDL